MFEINDNVVKKGLVALAIEQTLIGMGKPVLEEVTRRLLKEYKCYVPDCYEHPEYLKKILGDLYGSAHSTITDSIQNKLSEFRNKESIAQFITVMVK